MCMKASNTSSASTSNPKLGLMVLFHHKSFIHQFTFCVHVHLEYPSILGPVALSWLDQFERETKHLGERMLGMDQHGPQMMQAFRDKMQEFNIFPVYTPPECTDVVAPVDHHCGARIKTMMGWLYHLELEADRDRWTQPPGEGGLHAWERRVKMAKWLAVTWSMVKDDSAFFRSAFVSTGFLIALDGSENSLIKVPGFPDYDFNN
jgi:hypothetical protein